jgi:ATP-binding cassette subfamily B (MDR/TAP) protein 1
VPDISSARSAASELIRLLDAEPEINAESTEGKIPQNIKGHIRFQDVHFRYPTRLGVHVLRGLNLSIEPGTYVALVGASGCGKSTVYVRLFESSRKSIFKTLHRIQLIERFYDPLSGAIYMDDRLISDLNIQEYRKQLALVSQDPVITDYCRSPVDSSN